MIKKKLTTTKQLQKECDDLLSYIAKKQKPMCEALCGNKTQVGHHWIEKSRSAGLRYNIDNLVSLCNVCHSRIHNKFKNNVVQSIDIALIIIKSRGTGWYKRMSKLQADLKDVVVKRNKGYYQQELERLNKLLK